MGLLTVATPMPWEEAKQYADYVRKHGILQFINIYYRLKDRHNDSLKFGEEVNRSPCPSFLSSLQILFLASCVWSLPSLAQFSRAPTRTYTCSGTVRMTALIVYYSYVSHPSVSFSFRLSDWMYVGIFGIYEDLENRYSLSSFILACLLFIFLIVISPRSRFPYVYAPVHVRACLQLLNCLHALCLAHARPHA